MLFVSQSDAGQIQDHTQVRTEFDQLNDYEVVSGANSASSDPRTHSFDFDDGTHFLHRSFTSAAFSRSSAASLLKLSATGTQTSKAAGEFPPGFFSLSSGHCRDIISLAGSEPLPQSIRVNFLVEGTLSATFQDSDRLPDSAFSYIGITVNNAISDLNAPSSAITSHTGEVRLNSNEFFGTELTQKGWDSISIGPGNSILATYSREILYDSGLGGYAWEIFASNKVSVVGNGAASALFGNSIGLSSVTLANGDPLTGFSMSFDSGLSFAAIPEPSSFLLMAAGGMGLISFLRRSHVSPRHGTPAQ